MLLSLAQRKLLFTNLTRADVFNQMMYRRMMQGKLIVE